MPDVLAAPIPRLLNAGADEKEIELTDIRVLPPIRYAFYLYAASISFETLDLGVPVELTSLTFGILLLTLLLQPSLCLKRPPLAFACFFLYTAVFAFPVVTREPPFAEEAAWQLKVLLHLVLMSWVAFNLMKSDKIARNAILTFAMSISLVAVLQLAGISEETTNYEESIQRTTSFGFHPNNLARLLSLGLLVLVGLKYGGVKDPLRLPRLIVWVIFAVICLAIIETGSRGGLLALLIGLSLFVFRQGGARAKLRNLAIVVAGFALVAFIAFQSTLFQSRMERAMDDGDLARREQIYPTAWKMFLERPIVGWGGKASEFELGTRLAHVEETSKNPHNLVLYVLVATGLVGAIPMLLGLLLTVMAAWRFRNGPRGILPLSLLATVLMANMSGLWLHNKMHWFVVAFALSSTSVFVLRKRESPDTGLQRIETRPTEQKNAF